MSKDTPEVGDIWIHKKHKTLLHIIEVGSNFITFLGCKNDVYPNKTYQSYCVNSFSKLDNDPRYTYFMKIFEYKCKSKVKIEDLFKMGNE